MSTLIGRWRHLWQQPFVRLLREKYRKFRFGFPPSPFSLAFLFTPRKVLEISLKKRKEKKERFTGYRTTCQRKKWKISLESKKKNWKKIVERGGQIRSRTSPRDFNGIVNSIVPEQLWPIFTDAGQPTPFLHARRPCPFTLDLTFRHVFSFDA